MDVIPWMIDMNIEFSKAIEVKPSEYGGTGVFATRAIANGDILLKIPKSAVLSANTCGIANVIAEHPEVELLNLAVVAYLFEKSLGKESPWFPFIEFVEKAPVPDVPRLWSQKEQDLLTNTNLSIWDGLDSSQLQENYETCRPLFEDYATLLKMSPPSYDDFVRATLIVSSRAFDIDNYHGLAIAPGACFFNHSDNETVHFESDGIVCPLCGSLSCGCIVESDDEWENEQSDEDDQNEQDDDSMSENQESSGSEDDESKDEKGMDSHDSPDDDDEEDNACVIKALKKIKPGEEIFNTYGEDPNGILLARYGFTIWNNQHEVIDLSPQIDQFAQIFKVSKTVKSWRTKQEAKLEEQEQDDDDDEEEDPLFVGFINSSDGPRLSSGLISLARKLKIDKNIIARELALLRLKTYALKDTSAELLARAEKESDCRKKHTFTLLGTEKLLLENVLNSI